LPQLQERTKVEAAAETGGRPERWHGDGLNHVSNSETGPVSAILPLIVGHVDRFDPAEHRGWDGHSRQPLAAEIHLGGRHPSTEIPERAETGGGGCTRRVQHPGLECHGEPLRRGTDRPHVLANLPPYRAWGPTARRTERHPPGMTAETRKVRAGQSGAGNRISLDYPAGRPSGRRVSPRLPHSDSPGLQRTAEANAAPREPTPRRTRAAGRLILTPGRSARHLAPLLWTRR
jgi:hypothetical protein